jgi:hypothetical protein
MAKIVRPTRQSGSKALAKAKADRYFSEYIRKRDSRNGIAVCCTCGKATTQFDCGHFISRKKESTRYHPHNAHAQCLKCNRFEHGRQFEHGVHVDRVHGPGTADHLLMMSRQTSKRSQVDYEWIANHFREEAKKI